MSNLKPSPAPEGSRPHDRRVSWGNYRVREYLRNDALSEVSSDEQSITYLAPQDSFEGPVAGSESSSEKSEQHTPMSPVERETPRDQMMVTPIRVRKSPAVKQRASLISRGKLTPMKSYGFSLRRLANLRTPLPPPPLQPALESKYSIEARQRLKDFESRLIQLKQDKTRLTAFLNNLQTQTKRCRGVAEEKQRELMEKTAAMGRIRPSDLSSATALVDQLQMASSWEVSSLRGSETLWHHSCTFYNWQHYSLFHLRQRSSQWDLYTVGDWPEPALQGVFRLLWERRQRLFQEAAAECRDVLDLAAEAVDATVLFMNDLWTVNTAFVVEDTEFTDVEMFTIVLTPSGRQKLTTNLSTLRTSLSSRSGKMSSLLRQ